MRAANRGLCPRLGLALLAALLLAPAGPEPELRLMPVVGRERSVLIEPDQTLLDVAADADLGFAAVERLNPDVDPWIPPPGTVVHLPTRYILPPFETKGLLINVPEMRLYDFSVSPPEVFAIAIGDEASPSLHGRYRIGAKRENPAWHVPASIRAEKPELPAVVPAGPDNPLGSRWMTIGNTSYGIHGTNVKWSIGREATHGCIRLYEPDIQRLYARTPTGTPILIVYLPWKWGIDGAHLFLEAHPDPYQRFPDRLAAALRVPQRLGLLPYVDLERVWKAVTEARGIPIPVGKVPRAVRDTLTSRPTS